MAGWISGQPKIWGSVGVPNRSVNQRWTMGSKAVSAMEFVYYQDRSIVFRLAAVLPIREPLQIVFILATLVAGGFIW